MYQSENESNIAAARLASGLTKGGEFLSNLSFTIDLLELRGLQSFTARSLVLQFLNGLQLK